MRNTDPTFGDLNELRQKMLRWARKMVRNAHHAEDLVQDALLRMFANRHKFDPAGGGVDQWARVVLLNVFRGHCRTEGRMPTVSLDWSVNEVNNGRNNPAQRRDPPWAPVATDNPHTAVYCHQVCAMLGFDAAMLLADPEVPMTPTVRVRRLRLRRDLEARVAA